MQAPTMNTNSPCISVSDTECESMSSHTSSSQDNTQILHPFQFPWRLHEMLEDADKNGYTAAVSWLPDEKSFKVHKQETFVNQMMPRYFNQTKYRSFQRQLNVWGFERVADGPGRGGYTHKWFVRNEPSLCHNMKRERTKGTKKTKQTNKRPAPCTAPPSCIATPAFETSSGFVIDHCLIDNDNLKTVSPQDEDLDEWFQNLGKQSNLEPPEVEPVQLSQPSGREMSKQFVSMCKKPLRKEEMYRYQDLKYVMIGLKWGNSIFENKI